MSQTERHKRLRLLLKKLNRQRKWQASRVDILCNDLISAHRVFLHRLQGIGFSAEFYRSLLGSTDLHDLLTRAGRSIRQELPGVSVRFFLRQTDGYGFRAVEHDLMPVLEGPGPEELLPAEVLDSICKSNRPCTTEDMRSMGLEDGLDELDEFSMATLPLQDLGRSLGFLLLYRRLPETLDPRELGRIELITCGLSEAIRAARVPLPSAE